VKIAPSPRGKVPALPPAHPLICSTDPQSDQLRVWWAVVLRGCGWLRMNGCGLLMVSFALGKR